MRLSIQQRKQIANFQFPISIMSPFIKICGLAREEDVRATVALRPDAIGFIFWPKSKRAVTPEQVRAWTTEVPSEIEKVGVFVDLDVAAIKATAQTAGLDIIQLHGASDAKEPICYTELVQSLSQIARVWQVLHVDKGDVSVWADSVDACLIDSYSSESPGGTGRTCNWDKAAAFVASSDRDVLLAGGLTPSNVAEAIRMVKPRGVDVSSGVEAEPGKKDIEKVKAFIEICRNTQVTQIK